MKIMLDYVVLAIGATTLSTSKKLFSARQQFNFGFKIQTCSTIILNENETNYVTSIQILGIARTIFHNV